MVRWIGTRTLYLANSNGQARFCGIKRLHLASQNSVASWLRCSGEHHETPGTMSKLSFRARALDATKPLPVFFAEELPDLPDFAAINRSVPQMPTGMEKEEECEHHLQRAISAQQAFGHTGELVIPTPEVFSTYDETYEHLYPPNFKPPRQLIRMQPFGMDQDYPDYDMDSGDEIWLNNQAKKMDITCLQFEEMMDRLEKSSGQQVVTLKEAKLLLKEDDDLIIAVYDYWLNKRLKTQVPLIPQVKTERRDGSTNNNPYVAFRRRTEKMQTRKNRKNDESSYEKMLKLRRDLSRAVTLFEMVKRREKIKREQLHLTLEIFEKRYGIGDFSGQILAEVASMKYARPAFVPPIINRQEVRFPKQREEGAPRKKREYKRKQKQDTLLSQQPQSSREVDLGYSDLLSSEDDGMSPATSPSDQEDENDPDGVYAFRPKKYCSYHAPLIERLGNWPWCSPEEGGLSDKRYRYCLTSLSIPRQRCLGFARRRMGRGGRIHLDRAWTPLDDYWDDVDFSSPNGLPQTNEFLLEIRNEWLHFRPQPQSESSIPQSSNVEEVTTTTPTALVPENVPFEIDLESFQNHQEELFEMQRKQLERLKEEERNSSSSCQNSEHSFSSQPTSHFTLDSASVQFAVSAVRSTTQEVSSSDVIGGSLIPSSTSNSVSLVERGLPFCPNGAQISLTNGPVVANSSALNANDLRKMECFPSNTNPTSAEGMMEVSMGEMLDLGNCVQVLPSTDTGGSIVYSNPAAGDNCILTTKVADAALGSSDLRFPIASHNGIQNKDKGSLLPNKLLESPVNERGLPVNIT